MNPMTAINAMNHLSRIKMEEISDQANDVLARLRQQQELEDRDEIERELKVAHSARTQRELVAVVQRHAAQMAAAAASAASVAGLPSHFAGLAASVVSSNVNALPLNTVTSSANSTNAAPTSTLISSSSPSGASGSSGPSSSPAIQSIEAGKGYTFEEQFKQVCYLLFLTFVLGHVRSLFNY
jgi:hypothetical protein